MTQVFRQLALFAVIILLLICSVIQTKTKDDKEKKKLKMNLNTKEINEVGKDDDGSKSTKKKSNSSHAYAENAHLRPTKCQVCRVMVQELAAEVNKTSNMREKVWLTNRLDGEDKKDASKGKQIEYNKSEMRIYDILDSLCKKVYNYRSISGPEFPYLKGVKSMFRQNLEEMMSSNGLALTLDAPEEMVEDPTFELRRMMFQCNQMIEKHEDDIMDWYMEAQDTDPIDYICAEKVIDIKSQSCLKASTEIPAGAKEPLPVDKDNHQPISTGAKMEL